MRRWLKLAAWAAGGLLALLVVLGGVLYYVYDSLFYPDPPAAEYAAPGSPIEAQHQDVDYLRRLIALDRSFSDPARDQANARLAKLTASTDALDTEHLRIALLQITALADNGHTGLYSDAARGGLPSRLPLRLSEFSDGYRVMQTRPDDADLLGARVVAIDGVAVESVVARLATLRGGNEAFRRRYAGRALTSLGPLYGLGLAPSTESSTWRFERQDGVVTERTFAAYQPSPDLPGPDLWRSRVPYPDEAEWQTYQTDAPLPVTYHMPDKMFRALIIPDSCAALVQLKANYDVGGEQIEPFLALAAEDLGNVRPCAIILDLRQNGGGDYTKTAEFAARLPELAGSGGVLVLVGPDTFSAGITTAVFTRQAAPARVRMLGEPVGDRLAFWSEGGGACLPNAPFCFRYSTGRHDYGGACTDWGECFWLNWLYPARIDSLEPDEVITTSFAAFSAGRDPVLERAMELAGANARD